MDDDDQITECSNLFGETVINDNFQTVLIVNALVNAALSITGISVNSLIIFTILKSQNLQTPSYLLITSSAFTDLLMALVYHPFFVVVSIYLAFEEEVRKTCTFGGQVRAIYLAIIYFGSISVKMIFLISIDRYLALSLRHRYRIHVTKKRVRMAIAIAWAVDTICFLTLTLANFQEKDDFNYTAYFEISIFALTCFFYILSFVKLHRYASQVQALPNPLHGNFDVVKYRKTLKTMFAILICYVLCCAPAIFTIAGNEFLEDLNDIRLILYIIGYLMFGANSTISSVIYLARFHDIRQECRNLLNNLNFISQN